MPKFVFRHTLIFEKFWPHFTFLLITQNYFYRKAPQSAGVGSQICKCSKESFPIRDNCLCQLCQHPCCWMLHHQAYQYLCKLSLFNKKIYKQIYKFSKESFTVWNNCLYQLCQYPCCWVRHSDYQYLCVLCPFAKKKKKTIKYKHINLARNIIHNPG